MKRIATLLAATALTLTACSSGSDEEEQSLTEANEERLASLSFANTDELADALAEDHEGIDVYLDEDNSVMDGNIDIRVDSAGTELQDKNLTADIIETAGHGIEFDYETITVAIMGDPGTCGIRYTRDTIDQLTENGIIIPNIWDHADTAAGCNY